MNKKAKAKMIQDLLVLPELIEAKETTLIVETTLLQESKADIEEYKKRIERQVQEDKDKDEFKEALSNPDKRRDAVSKRLDDSKEYDRLCKERLEKSIIKEKLELSVKKDKRLFRAYESISRVIGGE